YIFRFFILKTSSGKIDTSSSHGMDNVHNIQRFGLDLLGVQKNMPFMIPFPENVDSGNTLDLFQFVFQKNSIGLEFVLRLTSINRKIKYGIATVFPLPETGSFAHYPQHA